MAEITPLLVDKGDGNTKGSSDESWVWEKLEASGGITLERLPRIGKIGVDFVSSGALTHSVKSADISLDIRVEK